MFVVTSDVDLSGLPLSNAAMTGCEAQATPIFVLPAACAVFFTIL